MTNLRSLDLNLLVVFEAIYAAGNVSQAATKLGVSQPTISNALSRLRDALDDPLFVRAGRGVQPTARATSLIGPVREALNVIEDSLSDGEEFDPTTSNRHFRLLLLDQLEPILMPRVIHQIQRHKSVTLDILPMSSTPPVDGLNDGSLDMVLATFVSNLDEVNCEAIGAANVVVVARQGHPDIGEKLTRDHISTLGHIALTPHMRALSRIDEALRHQNLQRHIVYTVTKFWSFPHIIANSDLIGFLPGDFAEIAAKTHKLNLFPMPFELPEQQIYMTWKQSRERDAGLMWLREQIKIAYEESRGA